VLSKETLSQRTAEYQNWVEAFARNHNIPVEWATGQRAYPTKDPNHRILARSALRAKTGTGKRTTTIGLN
jgi:hypothetical protein